MRDDPGLGQHGGMGFGAADVLRGQALVEVDGGVDFFHDGIGTACKTAAPHRIAHRSTGVFMSETSGTPPVPARSRRMRRVVFSAAILLIACGAVLYGFRSSDKQSAAACPGTAARAAELDPLVHGEVAALALAKSPQPMPALTFQDDG